MAYYIKSFQGFNVKLLDRIISKMFHFLSEEKLSLSRDDDEGMKD